MGRLPQWALVLLITCGWLAAFVLTLGTLIVLAPHVALPFAPEATGGVSQVTAALSLIVSVSAYVALGAFIAVRVNDSLERRTPSVLLAPIILTVACLTCILSIVSLTQVDRLANDGRPTWTYLYDPDIGLLTRLLFAGVAVGLWLKVRPLLTGYGMSERMAAALIVGANALIVAVVAGVVLAL